MNAQEIYDRVKTHLLRQGERAVDYQGRCVYWTVNGLRCAAGCLIPDGSPALLAMQSWSNRPICHGDSKPSQALQELIIEIGHQDLVLDLQLVHDKSECNEWLEKLAAVAVKHGLRP